MATMMLDGVEVEMPPGLAESMPTAEASPVPSSVTNFQARTALRHAGLFDAAEVSINQAATDMATQGDEIGAATLLEAWDRASFQRSSPLMASIAVTLNLTEQQLDELFRAAAAIEV